jgi:hypothetical protein
LGLEILKADPGVFFDNFIIFFVDHFAVEFPKFGQHLSLFVFVKIFLAGIEEMFVFLFDVLGVKVA